MKNSKELLIEYERDIAKTGYTSALSREVMDLCQGDAARLSQLSDSAIRCLSGSYYLDGIGDPEVFKGIYLRILSKTIKDNPLSAPDFRETLAYFDAINNDIEEMLRVLSIFGSSNDPNSTIRTAAIIVIRRGPELATAFLRENLGSKFNHPALGIIEALKLSFSNSGDRGKMKDAIDRSWRKKDKIRDAFMINILKKMRNDPLAKIEI